MDVEQQPVDSGLIRGHGEHLDVLRSRIEQVWITIEEIGHDEAAFGRDCGWILSGLGDRFARNHQLMSYLEQNLQLAVQGLNRVADGELQLAEMVGRLPEESDPLWLLVEYDDEPEIDTHVMDGVVDVIRGRIWLEPQLADAAPVAEFAVPADPMAVALRHGGLVVATTCVPLLPQMLDDLTGDPDVVATQATCWGVVAIDLRQIARDVRSCLNRDFPRHDQPGVFEYLSLMAYNVEALSMLADLADALALFTTTAGDLILLTRDIVRGLIADLFAQAAVWLADTKVVALPAMASRLALIVTACWRIHGYITALTASMASLTRCLED